MRGGSSRLKDGVSALKSKDESSSDSEDKTANINKNLSFTKRKAELMLEGGEVVEKRKKGRPRKDKMAVCMAPPFPQATPPSDRDTGRGTVSPAAVFKLPTPGLQRSFSLQVGPTPFHYIP